MKFKKTLKKILKKIYKIGTDPWVNIVVGLLFIPLWACLIYELGDDFCPVSFCAGAFAVIGMSIYDYGLSKFFDRRKKKRDQDPDYAS